MSWGILFRGRLVLLLLAMPASYAADTDPATRPMEDERKAVRKALQKKPEAVTEHELNAASTLLENADTVTVGGVYFGGDIQEENDALLILCNSNQAEVHLREILKKSKPEGQAYVLAALNELHALTPRDEANFLKNTNDLSFWPGGCIGGNGEIESFLEDWIKTRKLYRQIEMHEEGRFGKPGPWKRTSEKTP